MNDINLHIADFEQYCKKCKHKDISETEDPCNDCLDEPVNENSRKPVNFEPVE